MISVCITTHQHPRAVEMLDQLLKSTLAQDYADKEIIVSDDSRNYDVGAYCTQFPVRYYRNSRRGKSSINMNNAISHANGEIIKPMFGDDYFLAPNSLRRIAEGMKSRWAVCTSEHSNDRADHVPYHSDRLRELALGCNTYGCPSAIAFRKTDLRFDENLIWLMDCEFHARMIQKYGRPDLLTDIKIGIREWDGQVSNNEGAGAVRLRESEYVGALYP